MFFISKTATMSMRRNLIFFRFVFSFYYNGFSNIFHHIENKEAHECSARTTAKIQQECELKDALTNTYRLNQMGRPSAEQAKKKGRDGNREDAAKK